MSRYLGILRIEAYVEAPDGDVASEIFKGIEGVKMGVLVSFIKPESRAVAEMPPQSVEIEFGQIEVWGLRPEDTPQ